MQEATDWAGQVGENSATRQSFTATSPDSTRPGGMPSSSFAKQYASYTATATATGQSIADTTEVTNIEPFRFGLPDARLLHHQHPQRAVRFHVLVADRARPARGRVAACQFRTSGKVEGATIDAAGNRWNILARKAVNGQ
ncbi:hypothetical protein [Rhodococcus sp. ACT016]|uniref:hypothetical protein n=1 Tax=Rhodococcus sp. ACT016 TaxID=3134808 RepID=UPI003D2858F9